MNKHVSRVKKLFLTTSLIMGLLLSCLNGLISNAFVTSGVGAGTYTLRVYANGGTFANSSTTYQNSYSEGTRVTITDFGATKANSDLIGFNTRQDRTGVHFDIGEDFEIRYDIDLYAEWETATYTLALDNQNATIAGSSSIYEVYGTGYYLEPAKENLMTTSANGIVVPEKKYTISYNYNNATGGNTVSNATVTHTFGGYYTSANGSGTPIISANGKLSSSATTTTFNQNTTIYAKWTPGYVTLPTPTRTGYTFKGWYKDINLTTLAGLAGASYTDTQNITLYAKWEANQYTILLNNQGATTAGTTQIYERYTKGYYLDATETKQMTLGLNGIAVPERKYTVTYNYNGATSGNSIRNNVATYTFGGYYTSANGVGTQYISSNGRITDSADNSNFSTNGSLFAKWIPTSVTLPIPEKTGYTFGGWYTDNSFNTSAGGAGEAYIPTGNITLHAKWIANQYAITLSNFNSTTDGTTVIYERYGVGYYLDQNETRQITTSNNAITKPLRTGYTFAGYYTNVNNTKKLIINSNGNIENSINATEFSSNTELNVDWSVNTYNISYNLNNGTAGTNSPTSAKYSDTVQIDNPTKTGYSFVGWTAINADFATAKLVSAENNVAVTWDGTPAKNNYFTNLNPNNNATVTMVANWQANQYELVLNSNATVVGSTPKIYERYEQGFYLDQDETKQMTTTANAINVPVRQYTITYNYNNATGGNSIPSGTATYTFGGFFTEENGSGTKIIDENGKIVGSVSTSRFSKSVTLYAKWTESTITLPTPTRTGYTFKGWYDSLYSSSLIAGGGTTYIPTTDKYLYAQWEANQYEVTLDMQGGTYQGTEKIYERYGSNYYLDTAERYKMTLNESPITMPEKVFTVIYNYNNATGGNSNLSAQARYAFEGYYTATNGGGLQYINNNGLVTSYVSATNFSENGTLYAKWRPTSVTLPTPSKVGYTFSGWYTNEELTTPAGDAGTEYIPPQDVTLYAKWTPITYNITYDLNDDALDRATLVNPKETYNIESDDFILVNPTREGYTFTGWSGPGIEGTSTQVRIVKGSIENRTYTANWQINKYTVTCEDWFVNSSNERKVKLGSQTREYNYRATPNGSDWGEDVTLGTYYENYEYKSSTESAVTTSGATVYRYFWAWNNINVYHPDGTEKEDGTVATFSVSYNGGSYIINQSNQISPNVILPYGATIRIKDLSLKQNYYVLESVTWESNELAQNNGEYTATITKASQDLNINTRYNNYTIVFDGNTNTSGTTASMNMVYNTEKSLTENGFIKTGYTFTGWNTRADGTGESFNDKDVVTNLSYVDNDEVRLYAQWRANTYTISYNLDDVNKQPARLVNAPTSGTFDEVIEIPNPTRRGYVFKGWTATNIDSSTAKTGNTLEPTTTWQGTEYNPSTGEYTLNTYFKNLNPTANIAIVFTAKWEIITYTIEYELNNGTVSGNPNTYTVETDTFTLNNPTRNYYLFTGWTEEGVEGLHNSIKVEKGSIGNKRYIANWVLEPYSITYELNGGSVPLNPESYNIESEFTLNNPSKDGYSFTGWTRTDEGATQEERTTPRQTVTITLGTHGNRTFTANWQIVNYPILYNLNGGEAVNPETYTILTDTFTLNNPTRAGYRFAGWTGSNNSTPEQTVSITKGSFGEKTYTANWTQDTYIISYVLNGGKINNDQTGGNVSNITSYNTETPTFTLTNPVRDGFTFLGWTGSNGDIPELEVTIECGSIGDKEFVANWDINHYTITYNLNDNPLDNELPRAVHKYPNGTQVGATTEFDINTESFEIPNPTRDGYEFIGWTRTDDNATEEERTTPNTEITITKGTIGNRTYCANWQAITYVVTYNLNDDPEDNDLQRASHKNSNGIDIGNVTEFTIETESFILVNPAREGYTFIGWTRTDDSASTEEKTTLNTAVSILRGSTGNRTYKANWEIVEYTIEYNLNDNPGDNDLQRASHKYPNGNNVGTTTYTEETITFSLVNPTRDGYTFTGWTRTDDNATTEERTVPNANVVISRGTTGNRKYMANWQANIYTISYDLNDNPDNNVLPNAEHKYPNGTEVGAVTEYTEETATFSLVNPKRTGYDFIGWTRTDENASYDEKTNPNLDVVISRGTIGNRIYKANWRKIEYTITYNLNDNLGDNELPRAEQVNPKETYNIETETFTLVNPTRVGYDFIGWTGSNGDVPEELVTIPVGSHENREYVANWRAIVYTISYNLANEDDVDLPNAEHINPRESFTIENETFTLVNPTKNGYKFLGWTRTDNNASEEERTVPNTNVVILRGSINNRTYLANWKVITYTITYNLNDNRDDNDLPNAELVNPKETYNIETTTFSIQNPTRDGYTFTGWVRTDDSASTEERTVPNDAITIVRGTTGNRSYTAVWQADTFTITYNLNDNDGDSKATLVGQRTTYNIETESFSLAIPSRTGYTFIGWTGSNGTNPVVNVVIPRGSFGNKDYVANWERNTYTISYNLNDEDGDSKAHQENPITTYNVETESFNLVTPTRTGYTFTGWTGSNGNTPELEITIEKGSYGNKYFIAHWDIDTFTISYELDGGNVTPTNPTTYNVETETFTLVTPNKYGYDFVGWTGSNGVEPSLEVTIEKGSIGNKNYIANWTPTVYTITYELDEGVVITPNPETYTIETETFSLVNPTRIGYTFTGWTGSNGINTQEVITIEKGTTGNKEYTANWVPNRDTKYVVKHWLQKIGGNEDIHNPDNYSLVNIENLAGVTDTKVTPHVNIYEGFTPPAEMQINIDPDGSKILEYYYTRNSYELVVGNCEGVNTSGSTLSGTFMYGEEITLKAVVSAGYTWKGWDDGEIINPNYLIQTTMPAKDLNIAPKATKDVYTITYNLNEGNISTTKDTYMVTDESYILPTPTKVGYVFVGWTGSNGTQPQKNVTIEHGSTGNKEFTANWINDDNTLYIVRHWTQKLYSDSSQHNSENYDLDDVSILSGKSGSVIRPEVSTYEGFTSPEPQIAVIEYDGSAIIDYYYTRNRHIFNVEKPNGVNIEGTTQNGIYYFGEPITLNASVETGYTWQKWSDDVNEISDANYETAMPNRDVTYTPVVTKNIYTITYKYNNGIVSQSNPSNYNIETENFVLVNPEKEGYVFTGWTGSNGEEPELTVSVNKGSYGNKEFVANWEPRVYTITYNLDGGETEQVNPTEYTVESNRFTLNNPIKDGYTFVGWTLNDLDTPEKIVTIERGTTGNKVFTANYTKNTNTKYVVKHWKQNINGNKDVQTAENYTLADIDKLQGTTDDTIKPDVKTYEGFTSPALQTLTIKGDGSAVVNYYYLRNKYTFTLENTLGADVSTSTQSGDYYFQEEIALNAELAVDYSWDHWSNGDARQYTTFTMPANDVTIAPVTKKKTFTVTFKNGSDVIKQEVVVYNENATAPTSEEYESLVNPGYVLSWDKDFTNVKEDKVVNAVWTASKNTVYRIQYFLKEIDNEEYKLIETKEFTGKTDKEVQASIKQYAYYVFDSENENNVLSGIIKGDSSLVLKLYYYRNSFNIEYELNGGIASNLKTTYLYGEKVELPTDVVKEGYVFQGWYDNEAFEGNTISSLDERQVGDKIFYARWIEEEKYYLISSKYEINENYIAEIKASTTLDAFVQNLNTNGETVKVYRSNGKEVTNEEFVGTGNIVEITYKGEKMTYKLIVKGDITGEGKVTIADLTTLNNAILGKTTLNDEQKKAIDFDKNNRISIADLTSLNRIILGI